MPSNKIVSFDLDGTLVTMDFVDAVWLEKIPQLYANKHGISFEEAKREVEKEYLKIGPEALEWYDIKYWIEKFDLKVSWKDILLSCKDKLKLYPEVKEVLERLVEDKQLVIISNAANEFIEVEIESLGLRKYFSAIFSAVSNFGKTKKDKEIYEMVCYELGIKKDGIVHVGDNYEFDYLAAKQAGIEAYYLDRKGNMNGSYVVRNLKEFEEKIRTVNF